MKSMDIGTRNSHSESARDKRRALRDSAIAILREHGPMNNCRLAELCGVGPASTADMVAHFPSYFTGGCVCRSAYKHDIAPELDIHPHLRIA